jgi:hypothetical protein
MKNSGDSPQSAWQNGLVLALLAWLAAGLAYNRTFVEIIPPGDFGPAYDASPLTAMALAPIASLPQRPVAQAVFAACMFCLLLAIGLFARAMGLSFGTAAPLGIMVIVGFQFAPTILDLRHGQLDVFLLALLCVAYQLDKHDRPYRMAAAIAVGGVIHVWMLGLLFYLLLSRRPLAFLFGIVAFAAGVALVAIDVTWRHPWLVMQTALGYLRPLVAGGTDNQSILGAAAALFPPDSYSPLALYSTAAAGFAAIVVAMGFAGRSFSVPGGSRARLMIGLTTISLLLVLPCGKQTYFILLLPALWTLLTDEFSSAVRAGALAVYALLATTLSASLMPFMYLIAAVALWGVLLLAMAQADQRIVEVI